MALQIRRPREDEWPKLCFNDGRAFGSSYTAEQVTDRRRLHDLDRWRVAADGDEIASQAATFAFDVTLPGGATVPMGGVTWVSTQTTHRRQGLMRRVIQAIHDDLDERGDIVASLSASEGGIYEHVGYGIATRVRVTSIDRRIARLRGDRRPPAGTVRHVREDEDVTELLTPIWDRYRRTRTGEVSRSQIWQDFAADRLAEREGPATIGYHLLHADGYVTYRIRNQWNDGHPAHELHLVELVALTDDAHVALWQSLLDVDLVGTIHARCLAVDDPLPYLLENQRALRTTDLNDGIWVNVRDVATAFSARTYRTTDRIVVEADGVRWAIEGGPDGGSCRRVRTRPDLVTTHPSLGALLYGGVSATELINGRRMSARNAEAQRRADLFFTTALAPHCQTHY